MNNRMIIKEFGKDFYSEGGALTLDVSEVSDKDPMCGFHVKTHDSGWTIAGNVHDDYYTWVNSFEASHPVYGEVQGDFEHEVYATSEEAFAHFYENHKPYAWDYMDI